MRAYITATASNYNILLMVNIGKESKIQNKKNGIKNENTRDCASE